MKKNYYKLLKINRIIKSHRIKFAALFFADLLNFRHLFIRLDPVMACNLSCRMCYFSNNEWRKNHKGIFNHQEIEQIARIFFRKAYQLYIGCGAEPSLYKKFTDIVKLGKEYKIPFVGFVTNGQLITDEHINEFIKYKLDEITISTHGVKKETYEHLMVNSSYEKFINILKSIDKAKRQSNSNLPAIRINYTVNPDNLDELESFFEIIDGIKIDALQIRPIIDLGETEYKNKEFTPYVNKYNKIINFLHNESKKRNILFMANTIDPTYQTDNYAGIMMDYVRRHITPEFVWEEDFDWKNETYRSYCKRIKWRKKIFRNIFVRKSKISSSASSLSYDID